MPQTPPTKDVLLSVEKASEKLGISRATLYRIVKAGEMPYLHIMGRTVFRESVLNDYIATQEAKRAAE